MLGIYNLLGSMPALHPNHCYLWRNKMNELMRALPILLGVGVFVGVGVWVGLDLKKEIAQRQR